MIAVNELIQEAFEFVSMTGDGEAVSGSQAKSGVALLNRVVSQLNNDNYFSSAQDWCEVTAGGTIEFRKLEQGEAPKPGSVDIEPPESIAGVSRQVGIRWLQLEPSNPRDMMSVASFSLADTYCYQEVPEVAPSGDSRMVGKVLLNGTCSSTFRVFYNHRLPKYGLQDTMAISPLYYDAILYTLCVAICDKYKLYDYLPRAQARMSAALGVIDRNTLANRVMNTGAGYGSYMDAYYDGQGGNGLTIG